jgi:hypothetical protein
MYTELLIAIPLLFIIINIAVITELLVIRRKQYNHTSLTLYHAKTSIQRQFILLDSPLIVPVKHEPLLLTGLTIDYELADDIISELESKYGCYDIDNSLTAHYVGVIRIFDLSHLRDYLAYHLVKYPQGKLPLQSGTISYYDNKSQYTMNFYDASDIRCEKYIKTAMKLLKFKKVKRIDILTEAERIIKSKPRTVKGRTVTRKVKKIKVEV